MTRFFVNAIIGTARLGGKDQALWRISIFHRSSRAVRQWNSAFFRDFRISFHTTKASSNSRKVYSILRPPFGNDAFTARSLSQRVSPDVAHAPPQSKLSGRGDCDNFFKSAHDTLANITNNGIYVSASKMNSITKKLLQRLQEDEQIFCQWASPKIGPVCPGDIHQRSKLNPILFSPSEFQIDPRLGIDKVKEKVTGLTNFPDEPSRKGKRKSKSKMNRRICGLGLTPVSFVKNGSPSLSRGALQAILDNMRTAPSSDFHDSEMTAAFEALIRAKELNTRVDKAKKSLTKLHTENRLHLQHQFSRHTVGAVDAWRELALGKDALGALSAGPGNKLLVLHFDRAPIWALAQLSGCHNLRQRVESKGDLTAAGAILLYEGIEDAIAKCMLMSDKSQTDVEFGDLELLKELFPIAYNVASRLDSAFKHGGGVGGSALIRAISGCSVKEAQELRMRWYGGHPGVEQWHSWWRENALKEKVVETIMGQKFLLRGATSSGKDTHARVDRMLTEGMRSVIHGTVIEAIMSVVMNLDRDRVLQNHGWRVIFVADRVIVLEGPDHSIDLALPIVRSNSAYPFDVEDPVRANIDVEIVLCLDDLSRFSVTL